MKKLFAIYFCILFGTIITSCCDETPELEEKLFICAWGDSLTAGSGGSGTTYPNVLQTLLGDKYQVINCGVGGENTLTIAGRQGGIPMLLAHSVELPADTAEVLIGNKSNSLISSWNNANKVATPLLQGGIINTVNNCTIDGIECVLRWTGKSWDDPEGNYMIRRAVSGNSSVLLNEKSVIVTSAMKQYRKMFANIFFIGQGLGYTDNADLVAQYKAMIEYSLCENFILLGLTSGSKSERNELEILMTEEFGENHINLREYLSTNALQDANITPTPEDIQAMSEGKVPPSLLHDHVHFNATGYTLIGKLIYDRFHRLKTIDK